MARLVSEDTTLTRVLIGLPKYNLMEICQELTVNTITGDTITTLVLTGIQMVMTVLVKEYLERAGNLAS